MIKQGVREIFDNISLSVISFLENHIGITDVEFIERQGKHAQSAGTLHATPRRPLIRSPCPA